MPDVSENYSSLREAVNRILGQPAGGTAGTQGQGVELAPKPSFSSDLGNIATKSTISNTPFDPFAEQNAALAAVKAENARLSAQAAAPVVAAAVPVATAPVAATTAATPNTGPQIVTQGSAIYRTTPGSQKWVQIGTVKEGIRYPGAGNPSSYRKPSWQETAQYWKDLEAYQKMGGK